VRANRSNYVAIRDSLDVLQLIDFMLLWNWSANSSFEAEFRAAGPIAAGSGFKFWIADADGFLSEPSSINLTLDRTANTGPGLIFGGLVAEGHPDFATMLTDRIYRHFYNGGALTPEANLARMDARMSEITNSMVAECARWGYLGGRTPVNWQSDAQYARDNLFPYRNANLLTYMRNRGWYPAMDAPVLSQYGGSVSSNYSLTLSSGTGTIYYTLDGSDPRLAGGGISPGAIAWHTPPTPILPGSTWRYFNTNSAPTGDWTNLAYNDSAWPAGAAPLGYGIPAATTLSYGTNASDTWRSYYFRQTFTVPSPTIVTQLTVHLVRDDGAVVYLNGAELFLVNMPAGM